MSQNPTQNGGVRPMGAVVIEYNPNTGALGYRTQGLSPVEEVGVAQWFVNVRIKDLGKEAEQRVSLASPVSIDRLVKN